MTKFKLGAAAAAAAILAFGVATCGQTTSSSQTGNDEASTPRESLQKTCSQCGQPLPK